MASTSNPYLQRAARHERRARNYRRQAQSLLERDRDLDCAGALIYESAKQCINALANQQGSNPGTTGGKERFLDNFASGESAPLYLMQRWKSVTELHVHADRGHLDEEEFMERWERAQLFIDQMLTIYGGAQ